MPCPKAGQAADDLILHRVSCRPRLRVLHCCDTELQIATALAACDTKSQRQNLLPRGPQSASVGTNEEEVEGNRDVIAAEIEEMLAKMNKLELRCMLLSRGKAESSAEFLREGIQYPSFRTVSAQRSLQMSALVSPSTSLSCFESSARPQVRNSLKALPASGAPRSRNPPCQHVTTMG